MVFAQDPLVVGQDPLAEVEGVLETSGIAAHGKVSPPDEGLRSADQSQDGGTSSEPLPVSLPTAGLLAVLAPCSLLGT